MKTSSDLTRRQLLGSICAVGAGVALPANANAATPDAEMLVRAFVDIVNSRQFGRLSEIFSPDYIQHHAGLAGGVAPVVEFFEKSPSDMKMELVHTIAEGDYVAAITKVSGTANDSAFSSTGVDAWRIQDGKLAEHWDNG